MVLPTEDKDLGGDMWSDIETKRDYLNYLELAEVVSEVLLNPSMRPVSVGVFGTWGTGKSSLLNLIENQLQDDAKDTVIIIRFDAWLYQGYDDARAALMDVIARRLYEAAKKDAGLQGLAKSLLARVNTMRTLGLGIEVVAALHGVPLMGVGSKAVAGIGKLLAGTPEAEDTQAVADGVKAVAGLVDPAKSKSPPEHVDAFREEFQKLLIGLDKTLVVFVDNLDRCLPEQTIHTLEALRLFLFMEQSAFVVAADEDMVRHSVSQHFDGANERHVTDYLDKLIQIPVRVPRLGVTEIRAYLFMLFAEASEVDKTKLDKLRTALEKNLRASWKEPPITVEAASKLVGGDAAITMSFDIAERMSALLANSTFVEGNPRIVKRLLNVVRLRARIAERRDMPVDEAMVAKFALFERCADPVAVRKLYALINEAAQGNPRPAHKEIFTANERVLYRARPSHGQKGRQCLSENDYLPATAAVTIISTNTSGAAISHCAVARVDAASGAVHASQISFIPEKSFLMSLSQICAVSSRLLSVPASARNFSIFANVCRVCPRMSWLRSSAVCPPTYTIPL